MCVWEYGLGDEIGWCTLHILGFGRREYVITVDRSRGRSFFGQGVVVVVLQAGWKFIFVVVVVES